MTDQIYRIYVDEVGAVLLLNKMVDDGGLPARTLLRVCANLCAVPTNNSLKAKNSELVADAELLTTFLENAVKGCLNLAPEDQIFNFDDDDTYHYYRDRDLYQNSSTAVPIHKQKVQFIGDLWKIYQEKEEVTGQQQ
jgi:hypothetical protein